MKVSLEKIKEEFDELTDELAEVNSLGEVILCMDANAKIGLMGEDISRNGDLMIKALEESEMIVINGTDKCSGIITRQNRSRQQERLVIDLVTTPYTAGE